MFRFLKLIFFVIVAFIAGKMMAGQPLITVSQEAAIESPVQKMARKLADPEFQKQNPVEYRKLAAVALMISARALATIPQSEELES